MILLLTLETACHVYVPTASVAPEPGVSYKFVITDRGRVGFSDQLGPGVTAIEGRLVNQNSDAYVVSVATVETMDSAPSHRTGEQLTVNKGFVSAIRERQLSKGRTALAIGIAAGAIAAFFVTRALVGGGTDQGPGEPLPPPASVIIRP
jgi:hypothetical protein